jgi:hypothetical protein
MLITTLNGVFALIFAGIAWRSLPRGLLFTRSGWLTIRANAENPETRHNIERQRDLNNGTRFFLAGLGWLAAGIIAAGLAIFFAIITIQMLYF